MPPSKLAVLTARLGVLLALSFLLFLVTYARLAKALPPFGMFLYGAYLATVASLTLFAFFTLLVPVETNRARGRLISTLLALLLSSPFMYYVAAHVASGDGLRARGIPEAVSTSVCFVALASVAALVWTFRFWARPRLLDASLALTAVALLLIGEALLSRAQTQLATLLQMFAIFLAAQLSVLLLGEGTRALLRAGLAGAALVLGLVAIGLFLPRLVESGRRRALVAESSTAYVEARLFGATRAHQAPKLDRSHCGESRKQPPFPPLALGEQERRNVILISIDALRADHVLLRVQGKPLMPGLASFAQEGRYAPYAQSAFPATMLALSSAFTGYMPSDLLLAPKPLKNLFSLARQKLDSVEAVLPRGRYFTRPDVQAYLLSGAHAEAVGSARRQTGHAIARLGELRAEGKRHLLWVHYFEPHGPYDQQDEYNFGDTDLARYRSELAYVDEQLSRLLAFLREGGWYEDSLIMIFADHGESFGEHGHFQHHYLVYPWLVNVPLIWRAPGTVSARVDAPVHLMDVTPTVLHFLGLAAPGALRGVSLLAGDPAQTRTLFSEEISISGRMMLAYRLAPAANESELYARLLRLENGPGYASKLGVRNGPRYLIQRRASLAQELYAWESDPLAAHDLADSEPGAVRRLDAEAERFRSSVLARAVCDLPSER